MAPHFEEQSRAQENQRGSSKPSAEQAHENKRRKRATNPAIQLDGKSYDEQTLELHPPEPGYEAQLDALRPTDSLLQRKSKDDKDKDDIHDKAAQGVAGAGGSLPFLEQIQTAFGTYDVTGVKAHTGPTAAEAGKAIGAKAYATGMDVAFAETPDLHTAAHEAAHVVQQQAGVTLQEGVGQAGDEHEQHADAVADAVVEGKSAEPLLDQYGMGGGGDSDDDKNDTTNLVDTGGPFVAQSGNEVVERSTMQAEPEVETQREETSSDQPAIGDGGESGDTSGPTRQNGGDIDFGTMVMRGGDGNGSPTGSGLSDHSTPGTQRTPSLSKGATSHHVQMDEADVDQENDSLAMGWLQERAEAGWEFPIRIDREFPPINGCKIVLRLHGKMEATSENGYPELAFPIESGEFRIIKDGPSAQHIVRFGIAGERVLCGYENQFCGFEATAGGGETDRMKVWIDPINLFFPALFGKLKKIKNKEGEFSDTGAESQWGGLAITIKNRFGMVFKPGGGAWELDQLTTALEYSAGGTCAEGDFGAGAGVKLTNTYDVGDYEDGELNVDSTSMKAYVYLKVPGTTFRLGVEREESSATDPHEIAELERQVYVKSFRQACSAVVYMPFYCEGNLDREAFKSRIRSNLERRFAGMYEVFKGQVESGYRNKGIEVRIPNWTPRLLEGAGSGNFYRPDDTKRAIEGHKDSEAIFNSLIHNTSQLNELDGTFTDDWGSEVDVQVEIGDGGRRTVTGTYTRGKDGSFWGEVKRNGFIDFRWIEEGDGKVHRGVGRFQVQNEGRKLVGNWVQTNANGYPEGEWTLIKVQRKEDGTTAASDEDVQRIASDGVAGSGGKLPYLDNIQMAFGKHDVSGVQAHTGGAAADASKAIGAKAYATGNDVAFGGSPDLHTAAHEAAHIVQQRAGVSLKGGVGQAGDKYEQHADAVADAVVQGKSAEGLLDTMAGSGKSEAVQREESTDWRKQEDVNETAGMKDPVKRNYAITEGYYDKSQEMRDVLGYEEGEEADANWLTFAVWASDEAGRVIRGEGLPTPAQVKKLIVAAAGPLGFPASLLVGHVAGKLAKDVLDKVKKAIADGNQQVYAEIAAVFGAFMNTVKADKEPDKAKLGRFLGTLTPGPPASRKGAKSGQGLLAQAFKLYYDAIFAKGDAKSELIFGANALVGQHEQTRLQHYIARGLGGWLDDYDFTGIIEGAAAVAGGLIGYLLSKTVSDDIERAMKGAAKTVMRQLLTEYMMELHMPNETLDLGDDVPKLAGKEFPAELEDIDNPQVKKIMETWDANPDSLKGSEGENWADLPDRMNYIVDLFRSRQKDQSLYDKPPHLQNKASGNAPSASDVQAAAAQGVAGSGGKLPYLDNIQMAFGRHDVSNVQAHTGGAARDAASQIGAKAYATGNDVAFGESPDLHTAAHEAAHIVQQRAGVSLKGGVGQAGDKYEQHADAVADAVVAGQSAEGLLDTMAGSGKSEAVQSKAVQKDEESEASETSSTAIDIEHHFGPEESRQVLRWTIETNYEIHRAYDELWWLAKEKCAPIYMPDGERNPHWGDYQAVIDDFSRISNLYKELFNKDGVTEFEPMEVEEIEYDIQRIEEIGEAGFRAYQAATQAAIEELRRQPGVFRNRADSMGDRLSMFHTAHNGSDISDFWICLITEADGGATLPGADVRNRAYLAIQTFDETIAGDDLGEMARFCANAEEHVNIYIAAGLQYLEDFEAGGTQAIQKLEFTKAVSFTIVSAYLTRGASVRLQVTSWGGKVLVGTGIQMGVTAVDNTIQQLVLRENFSMGELAIEVGKTGASGLIAGVGGQAVSSRLAPHVTSRLGGLITNEAVEAVLNGSFKSGFAETFSMVWDTVANKDTGPQNTTEFFGRLAVAMLVGGLEGGLSWDAEEMSGLSGDELGIQLARIEGGSKFAELLLMDLTKNYAREPVSRKESGSNAPTGPDVQAAAAQGVAGSGGKLPYLDNIQMAFGRHDVSNVQAHTGGAARDAASQIGAKAYATGNDVAFGESPDLHTSAHEAAHIVQQRAGVSLKGGVGQAGDKYEQHADAVADAVVAGQSAEGLLATMAGGGKSEAVQSKAVQREGNSGGVVGDPALEHNAEKGADGTTIDPEENLFASPFDADGNWDSVAVLSQMSQVTGNLDVVRFDTARCGAEVALSPYIMSGPTAVMQLASTVSANLQARIQQLQRSPPSKVPGYSSAADAVEHANNLLAAVSNIPNAIAEKNLDILLLAPLAEGLFVTTVDDPLLGADGAEVATMAATGGAYAPFELTTGSGWADIQELFQTTLPSEPGVSYAIVLVPELEGSPHFINVGADAGGSVYLHDSWPREGSQMLWYPSEADDIMEYFESTSADRPRSFEIATRIDVAPEPGANQPVSRKESTPSAPSGPNVQAAAAQGVAGSGGKLPYLDNIQMAFGKHDVSNVQAHTGGAARDAASQIGAKAYATGNDVAFADSPDLHTSAHEAAHIVQQRAGVSLKGGVGQAGDKYEQHADAVADAVVAGQSAEGLLDTMAGSGKSAAVQSKAVQKRRRETEEQYEKRRARERKERKAKYEKSDKFREKLTEDSFQSFAMGTMNPSIKVSEIKKYFKVSSAWALGSKEIWQQLENSEATRVIGYCQRQLAGESAKKMARIFSKYNGNGQWDAEFRDNILAYYDVVAAADPLRAAIKKNRTKIQELKATQPIWLHFIRENTNRVNKMSFIKNRNLIVHLLNQAKRAVTILPKLIDKDIMKGDRMQQLLEKEIGNVFYAIELTRIAEKLDLKNLSSVIMAQMAVGTLKRHIGVMNIQKIAMPATIRDGQGREKRIWRSAWYAFVKDVKNYHNAKYFSSLTSVTNPREATITTLADVLETGAAAAGAVEGVFDAPMDFGPHDVGIYRNARSPQLSDPWVGTTGWLEDLGQAFTPYHKQITVQANADFLVADSGEDLAADYAGKTGLEQRAMKERTSSRRSGSKSDRYRDTMHDIKKVNRTVNWPQLQGWLINQFDTLDTYLATRIESYKHFKRDASWWHVIMPPNWDLGDLIKNFRRVRKQLPKLKRKAQGINDQASANSVFALFMKLQRNINAADMEVKKWSNSAVEFAQDAIMVSNILIDVGTAVLTTAFPPAAIAISAGVSVLKDVGTQIVADGNWKPAEMATNAGKAVLSGKLKKGLQNKFPLIPTGTGRMGKIQNFLEEVFYNQMLDTLVAPLTDSSGAFLLALYNEGDVGHALDEAGNAANARVQRIWSAEGIVRQMALTGTKQIVRSRMKAELQAGIPGLQWNEAEIDELMAQIEGRLSSCGN